LFFSSPKEDPGEILERKAIKKRRNLKKETNLTIKKRKKNIVQKKIKSYMERAIGICSNQAKQTITS